MSLGEYLSPAQSGGKFAFEIRSSRVLRMGKTQEATISCRYSIKGQADRRASLQWKIIIVRGWRFHVCVALVKQKLLSAHLSLILRIYLLLDKPMRGFRDVVGLWNRQANQLFTCRLWFYLLTTHVSPGLTVPEGHYVSSFKYRGGSWWVTKKTPSVMEDDGGQRKRLHDTTILRVCSWSGVYHCTSRLVGRFSSLRFSPFSKMNGVLYWLAPDRLRRT